MSSWTQPQTMKMAYAEIVQGERPWVALGDFANYFFDDDPESPRQLLIQDEIALPQDVTPEQEIYRWAVFCAASIVYLCHRYQLAVPEWVAAYPRLETPWFYMHADTNSVRRERYLQTTPPEFAERNIYCGDRIWQNKKEEAAKMRQRLISA